MRRDYDQYLNKTLSGLKQKLGTKVFKRKLYRCPGKPQTSKMQHLGTVVNTFLYMPLYLSFELTPRKHSSSQPPLLMSQSIGSSKQKIGA